MNWKEFAKYFVHGIVFSLLFTALTIGYAFGLIVLMVLVPFIGLMIGIGLLILIIGLINAEITEKLWFPVKSGFLDILFHGLVLFIALLVVNGILMLVPSLVFPGTATTILTFVIGSFINGFICKNVANLWEVGSGFFS